MTDKYTLTMKIYYGIANDNIDVTNVCLQRLTCNDAIEIPSGDATRSVYFTDPLDGVHKFIIIVTDDDNVTAYDEFTNIKINLVDNTITTTNEHYISIDINDRLSTIHSKLQMKHHQCHVSRAKTQLQYGGLNEEMPEQKMSIRYLTGNEKVLEIGGNLGRNSMVIASILKNDANLVTLECDPEIANQLTENRDLNNLKFHIESSALSNRKLIQLEWDTMPSESLIEGYKWVNTITLENLKTKYDIEFDTLVLDCEGAFYYILMDMPDILNNINLIIMENDYYELSHKTYIDDVLIKNNFIRVYVEGGGWGPCIHNFFEVWKKFSDTI
jgi:FkbM family methyltransferase